jgi:hypothetical protein
MPAFETAADPPTTCTTGHHVSLPLKVVRGCLSRAQGIVALVPLMLKRRVEEK